jgi:energy-coupling factor transporter ATP-binding protein EcfA2
MTLDLPDGLQLPAGLDLADFGILFIHGSTGSGKTRLARQLFGESEAVEWDPAKAIVSQFASPQDAQDRLGAVGLGDIPAWHRPFHCLSNGQQARALLARQLRDGAVLDDFTAWVNRDAACTMSSAMARFARRAKLRRVVVCSPCRDIIRWVQPDWLIDLDALPANLQRQAQQGQTGVGAASPPPPPSAPDAQLAVRRNPVDPSERQPLVQITCRARWVRDEAKSEYKLAKPAASAAVEQHSWWPLLRAPGLRVERVVVERGSLPAVSSCTEQDEATTLAGEAFDYAFDGRSTFLPPALPTAHLAAHGSPPGTYAIGVIVGPSGSGKTTILRELQRERGDSEHAGSPAPQPQHQAAEQQQQPGAEQPQPPGAETVPPPQPRAHHIWPLWPRLAGARAWRCHDFAPHARLWRQD